MEIGRKIGVRRMRRETEVETMQSKTRAAQEYHALGSPRLTTHIDQYFFLIDCSIFNSEIPYLPQIYAHARRLE